MSTSITEFLRLQLELQQEMKKVNPRLTGGKGGDPYTMSEEELAEFITWNHTALVKELGEALDEVGWKPWASSRHINGAAAIMEMVDAWHFFLNMMLAMGAWDQASITEVGEFFDEGYLIKRQKNLKRQQEGYDGVQGKCKHCKRELTDERHNYQGMEFENGIFCSSFCADEYSDREELNERTRPEPTHGRGKPSTDEGDRSPSC